MDTASSAASCDPIPSASTKTTLVVPGCGGGPLFQVLPTAFEVSGRASLQTVFQSDSNLSAVVEGDVFAA